MSVVTPTPAIGVPTPGGAGAPRSTSGPKRSVTLVTAERVPLTLPLAGLGERAIAYGADLAVVIALIIAAGFVYNTWGDVERDLAELTGVGALLLAALVFLLAVSYDVLFEQLFDGRTPGKRLVRIRVVSGRGERPDFTSSLTRNALRLVDFMPGGYGVGSIALFLTGSKRLGDLVAGTFVISERARRGGLVEELTALAGDTAPPPLALDDEGARTLLAAVEASRHLEPRYARARLGVVVTHLLPALDGPDASARAAAVLLAQRRAPSGVMAELARVDDAATTLAHALDAFRRRPRRADVDALDDAIRHASSTLMRATQRDVHAPTRERLSLLLLDAARLRRPTPEARARVARFLVEDVPRAVYDERALVGRAALVLFGAAATGFALGYGDDAVARALLGDDLALAVDRGAAWTNRIEEQGAYLHTAGTITFNNVRVGFLAFALGLAGGMGTLLVLVGNGLHLGAVFGAALRLGHAATLARFILAHGPIELSSVCVAGAAGFCLGRAVLKPGDRPRGVALREDARQGGRLLFAATLGFVVIGGVEGFVSPGTTFPPAANAALGLFLWAIAIAAVVVLGGRVRVGDAQGRAASTTRVENGSAASAPSPSRSAA